MVIEFNVDPGLIVELGEEREGPCVSMYMPSVGAGDEARQDEVRLRNLLREAEDRLANSGMRPENARRMLDPVRDAAALGRWAPMDTSLGVFASPGSHEVVRFRSAVSEGVTLAKRFVTRPILPDLAWRREVLVLAISRGSALLYKLDGRRAVEVNVPGMPPSVEAVSQYEDPERQLQFRSGGGSGGEPVFHGHGGQKDSDDDATRHYMRMVAESVSKRIRDRDNTLVVLSGPEELLSEFERSVDGGTLSVDDTIAGTPDRIDENELARRAQSAAEADAGERMLDAVGRFNEVASTRLAAQQVREALPAAHQGRVEHLFIAQDAVARGRFDPSVSEHTESTDMDAGTDDLLDLAAHYTLKNGGQVHVLPLEDMPGGAESGPAAAILRG